MTETKTTPRRVTFNSQLRNSEDNFKLMVKVLTHLSEVVEGQTFEGLWEHVSSKPVEYYRRHFRRENKRTNPLSDVKRPRTAYTFFTQERRNAIKEANTDKTFGDISKILAAEWHSLSDKKRAVFVKREQADKQRYATAKAEIEASLAAAAPEEQTPQEPVAVEETPVQTRSPAAKKARTATKKPAASKKGGRRK
jgi:hypothetical protein